MEHRRSQLGIRLGQDQRGGRQRRRHLDHPPTQTATLNVVLFLRDDNGDDGWFGLAGYTLIHLGSASPRDRRDERRMSRNMKWEGDPIR
jgi:hypothetical protein